MPTTCQEKEEEVQRVVTGSSKYSRNQNSPTWREEDGWVIFTLCPCLHRSFGRSDFHLKELYRFKGCRRVSVRSFLWVCMCLVLSDGWERSDFFFFFAKASGNGRAGDVIVELGREGGFC